MKLRKKCLVLLGGSTTKGFDIYQAFTESLEDFKIPFHKISSICTDGAPAMLGKNCEFIGQLNKHKINPKTFHCIIHHQNLASKFLNKNKILLTVVKIINKIARGS